MSKRPEPKQQTHNFESSAHMRTQTVDFQKGDSKKVDATKCRLFKNNNTVIFV